MTFRKSTIQSSIAALIVGFIALIVLSASAYITNEAEQAVVLQFGEPMRVVKDPGLHFKIPFIQDVVRYDKRLIAWDGDPNEIPTKGREFIYVDTTARWRIVDPQKFLESVRDEAGAMSRLDDILDSAVRDEVSSLELVEIVRSSTWEGAPEDIGNEPMFDDQDEQSLNRPIIVGREGLTRRILERASATTQQQLGIELVDVRIKRLNYVRDVQQRVYDRMISERQRIAAQFRSEGEGRSAEIRGGTAKQLQAVRSEAQRKAEIVRGRADADATRIYAEAYSADPEFYSFLRTIESYGKSITGQSTLVIGTDSDYFKYLKSIGEVSTDFSPIDVEARLRQIEQTAPAVEVDVPLQLPAEVEGGEDTGGDSAPAPEEAPAEAVGAE
ncbi:MAG: protease modulator HflC [Sumerlaeia bacterium]